MKRKIAAHRERQPKSIRVYVGFTDGAPHFSGFLENDRNPGYTVCKSKAKCLAMYVDVRRMWLTPYKPKDKA